MSKNIFDLDIKTTSISEPNLIVIDDPYRSIYVSCPSDNCTSNTC